MSFQSATTPSVKSELVSENLSHFFCSHLEGLYPHVALLQTTGERPPLSFSGRVVFSPFLLLSASRPRCCMQCTDVPSECHQAPDWAKEALHVPFSFLASFLFVHSHPSLLQMGQNPFYNGPVRAGGQAAHGLSQRSLIILLSVLGAIVVLGLALGLGLGLGLQQEGPIVLCGNLLVSNATADDNSTITTTRALFQ